MRAWALLAAAACGPTVVPETPVPSGAGDLPVALVLTERASGGGRLVIVDERGDRQAEVLEPAAVPSRDVGAAFSPDGRWLVFASSRGRPFNESSLWIAPVGADGVATRITADRAIDMSPVWTRDGHAVVFASTRGGGAGLWRLPLALDGGRWRIGEPVALTHGPGAEMSPTTLPDGSIVYTAIEFAADSGTAGANQTNGAPAGAGADGMVGAGGSTSAVSRLERLWPDGRVQVLTNGPADSTPSVSPSGDLLAFARPVLRVGDSGEATVDADIVVAPLTAAGLGEVQSAIAVPVTDESSPAWSIDGEFLFATSLARDTTGRALLTSVVHVDRTEPTPNVRMLVDRTGAVARMSVAVAPSVMHKSNLRSGPVYQDELVRILTRAIEDNQRAAGGRR